MPCEQLAIIANNNNNIIIGHAIVLSALVPEVLHYSETYHPII